MQTTSHQDQGVAPTYSVVLFKASELPEQYMAMIYSKWLRSLRFGNPLFKSMKSDSFYNQYHAYIGILLKKPDSLVKMAVLTDDHDIALGFSVSREDVLDYIYVHKDHRRQGIGKKLYPAGITTMSHTTLTAIQIWRNNPKYIHLEFNPFA